MHFAYHTMVNLIFYFLFAMLISMIFLGNYRDQASTVLWFAKTFGLIPRSMILEEESSGIEHTIRLGNIIVHICLKLPDIF